MKLSAIVMVKDEEEFVGYVIMSMYHVIDEFIVVDGGSTDGTRLIIQEIINKYDFMGKIKFWVDNKPKNRLIETRNEMLSACTGDWIIRLEGDEVYSDFNAMKVRNLFSKTDKLKSYLSVGWPYLFFAKDINQIVPIGKAHTYATIAIKNNVGIFAAHHDKGGDETFYDEGWFIDDMRSVSIWHPRVNKTKRFDNIFIHHYAGFKRTTRHFKYLSKINLIPYNGMHPEVFFRFDFRTHMKNPGSVAVVTHVMDSKGNEPSLIERIRY